MIKVQEKINVEEALLNTKSILHDNLTSEFRNDEVSNCPFKQYSPFYRYTTENLDFYYQLFPSLKNYLTVAGSGDQVLNAISYGAKNIYAFDINCLCKYLLALKIAAIKRLSPQKFIKFFNDFSKRYFDKLVPALKEDDLKYWTSVFDNYPREFINLFIFSGPVISKRMISKVNTYLKGHNYYMVREKVDNTQVKFINSSLEELPSKLDNTKFNAISLSNIYDYLDFTTLPSTNRAQNFLEFIRLNLLPRITNNGMIMASYLYSFDRHSHKVLNEALDGKDYCTLQELWEIAHSRHSSRFLKKSTKAINIAYTYLINESKLYNARMITSNYSLKMGANNQVKDSVLVLKK